ncbi:hypothetical protein ANCCAN_01835 [Ancylostoma caninum]|uniref:Uncharacterized protein n=1 Tax=Ancylostoma caninum TaxID=29170 RepID=A0A368H9R0_ANCCA|nr:hypothetical protein ANCCAN_01835 [Ancylostoma caninum]
MVWRQTGQQNSTRIHCDSKGGDERDVFEILAIHYICRETFLGTKPFPTHLPDFSQVQALNETKRLISRPDRAPTIRWIYAEFDPSLKHKADYVKNPRVSRCQMNGETGSAEVLVQSKSEDEQVPGTSKSLPNGHAIFNRTSSSEPKHLRSSTPPPKPARFALTSSRDATSESSSFIANDAFTECSPGVQSDHEAVFGRRRSTPPLMTSTPYTTLERKDRFQAFFTQ